MSPVYTKGKVTTIHIAHLKQEVGAIDVDDILEFSPTSGKWTVVDNMMKARRRHAVSVIKSDNVEGFCIN